MINKAIILAGGTGTRLRPATIAINKHLIPIYDKPLIYYPISLLMLLKIKKFLIIINEGDKEIFKKLLGDGKDLGIKIEYGVQKKPLGIPEAFKIGKKFIGKEKIALILGDNIFYGQGLIDIIKKNMKFSKGAKIFCYPVNNPKEFGVAKIDKNKIKKIIEKPKKFVSNLAITGLYFFDNSVIKVASTLKPSKRNETEITDVLNYYLKKNKLFFSILGRGSSWLDTGNPKNNLNCSNFVNIVEERQNFKIGCLEEIAFKNNWITKKKLLEISKKMGDNEYSRYLKNIF